ncbi:MAG: zinc-ribbon domain-containing protein [Nitrososphaera sp.]
MEKSVGMAQQDKASMKYCVECGAKMPKAQKTCPACGEGQ